MLTPVVFKAYDIRGIYGKDWDADGAAAIARAFVEKFAVKTVVLGFDMRATSIEIVAAVEKILVAAGVRIINIGQVTTPTLYFAVANYADREAGIMVTASHNPSEWNGMKFCLSEGSPVGENSGLLDIKEMALEGMFAESLISGSVEYADAIDPSLDYVTGLVHLNDAAPMNVVIDCGNGMEGATIQKLLQRVPAITAHVMFGDPDGTFPNHEANPLKESTLADLKKEVVARGAAFGVAFDGDGDRIGFVNEKGEMVGADILLALVSGELLKKHLGARILYDLRARSVVGRVIAAAGGIPGVCRVGHAFIKEQMRRENALFAGELSGHFYAKEFFSVESADYMFLLVVQLLQTEGKSLSELAAGLFEDAHSGEINYVVEDRAGAIKKIHEAYEARAQEVLQMDGLSFVMHDWWFNVRPSNTEPFLRLNMETRTSETLMKYLAEFESILNAPRALH